MSTHGSQARTVAVERASLSPTSQTLCPPGCAAQLPLGGLSPGGPAIGTEVPLMKSCGMPAPTTENVYVSENVGTTSPSQIPRYEVETTGGDGSVRRTSDGGATSLLMSTNGSGLLRSRRRTFRRRVLRSSRWRRLRRFARLRRRTWRPPRRSTPRAAYSLDPSPEAQDRGCSTPAEPRRPTR